MVSPESPDGPELLLEPDAHPAARAFKIALAEDGIPGASFSVDDIEEEFRRLKAEGVALTQDPTDFGPVVTAVLDDTCGNLIQIACEKAACAI